MLSSGVFLQEFVALAWLRLPVSSLHCDLAHMVPQDLVERGVRHLLDGFGREVVRGKDVPMLPDELGDKLTNSCTLVLKSLWARKGILRGRLYLGTVAFRNVSTRRSLALALDRQGCSMWLMEMA